MKEELIKLKHRLENLSRFHDDGDETVDVSGILYDLLELLIDKES